MKNKFHTKNLHMKILFIAFFLFHVSIPLISQRNFENFTYNMDLQRGYFNYYWDNSSGKIYLEIQNLDQEFLYINYLSAGVGSNDIGLDRGQIGNTRIVYFTRIGPKILMVQPNYKFRAKTNNREEQKAVEDAFAKSILWGFVVLKEEKQSVLVDATEFLLRDSHGVIPRLKRQNQGNYNIDKSRTSVYVPITKNFPKNTEFESQITFKGSSSGSWIRSVTPSPEAFTIRTHHSFVELPDDDYKPRKFDPRAGYGALTYYDYSTPINQSIEKKLIRRHRLEKKYPNQEFSEAKEPIIYYLDRGTPEPVRSALIDGASWWNEAYEAAGFKNAFQVKIMPEGADMLDVRYNVIQWVHRSTRGWSYGSSVIDPRTGEIIKGHVTLGSLRVRQDYLIAEGLLRPYENSILENEMEKMSINRLKQLSAHEVGHTLGLSHNYIASARNRKSVMDYPHPLIKLKDDKIDLSDAYDDNIGEWDKLAINWGYRQFNINDESNELERILQEGYKNNIFFITDQDSRPQSSAHPRSHLWDNGYSAVEELNRMLKLRKHILDNFSTNSIKTGEPMAKIEEVLVPMYLLHRFQIEAASKVIGGLEYNYAMKGDGQLVEKMLSFDEQNAALESLFKTIEPENLLLPETLLQLIPPRAFGYPRTRETFQSRTGLTFDYLSASETVIDMTLSMLLNYERASRLIVYAGRGNIFSFNHVISSLINKTIFKSQKNLSRMEAEIQRMVNYKVLNHLFFLAGNKDTHEQVNAIVNNVLSSEIPTKLNPLKDDNKKENVSIKKLNNFSEETLHNNYLLQKIKQFYKGDIEIVIPNKLAPPDGSPIGMDLFYCRSLL